MNPLDSLPKARKVLYTLQYVISGVMLLIGVGYGASGHSLPQWYGITSAVLAAAWTYLGITASSNVDTSAAQ